MCGTGFNVPLRNRVRNCSSYYKTANDPRNNTKRHEQNSAFSLFRVLSWIVLLSLGERAKVCQNQLDEEKLRELNVGITESGRLVRSRQR
jgi:hypothetical protein